METPPSSAGNDWRPFHATGIALGVAFALNLATGNGLWLGYTLIGLGGFFTLVGLVRVRRWRIPPGPAWGAGLAGALHYLGGSLSGLHQVGGPNGLYYAFPWWDNVVHFLGSISLALIAHIALGSYALPRWLRGLLAASLAVLAGVLVELYEFAQFLWLGTVDQGFYTNTVLDLYYNLLGASAGAVAGSKGVQGSRAEARPLGVT